MVEMIYEDLRKIVLGMLFVTAFGWMGAQLIPGEPDAAPQHAVALAAK